MLLTYRFLGVNLVLVSTRVHSDTSKFSVENESYHAHYSILK